MKKLIIVLISCYTFAIQSKVLSINLGPDVLTVNEVGCYEVPKGHDGILFMVYNPPCQPFVTYTGEEILCVNAGPFPGEFLVVCLLEPPYHHLYQPVRVENILPAELTSFLSIINGSDVHLQWKTASEVNNSGFDIERRDARGETEDVWNKIGFINGNGTSTSPNNYEFTDRNLSSGKYNYRLKQIDFNGNYEYYDMNDEVVIGIPEKFAISQNFPNPFNPDTKIEYSIPNTQYTLLRVYNSLGKEVATLVNEIKPAGRYEVTFDGSNLGSGVYFYKITAGSFSAVKRMILVK